MPHCDVAIVGAGVIGSSIAYHLGKHGMSSVVVERESIGTRASGKAWAVISALSDQNSRHFSIAYWLREFVGFLRRSWTA